MDTPAEPLPSEQDGDQSGEMMHCEELLRNTLHSDDKEKLRRKLALLQREYLRTAERLQRAERLDAVKRHVRSRISRQHQRDPEVTSNPRLSPSSLVLNTTNGTATSEAQCQGHAGDSDNSKRSQVNKFLPPSDAACHQTLDTSHDAARDHRPSPALRLRSRRSRLRWERRSVEAGRSDNSEGAQEQSERMETFRAEGSEERIKTEGVEVVNESEELFSGTDSESPSLLLTHWNTCGQTETGDIEGKDIRGRQEQRGKETKLRAEVKESTSLLLTCQNSAIHTEEREQDGTQTGKRKETEGGERQRDGKLCEDLSDRDTEENAAEKIESDNAAKIKEEQSELVGGEHDVKGVGLLDSCTLVEGLLFPAEYYVRTTRRMTFSQSQPDMQAVILSQLSIGRRRRSRGRGSNTHSHERSDVHSHTGLSSPTTASVSPRMESQSADTSAELNSQSSSEISDQISACQIDRDACFSPTVTTARPARGRKRRRGRGRGRPQTPRCSLSLDTHQLGPGQTSDDPQPSSSPGSSSPSVHGTDGPKSCITPGEAVPTQDDPKPASTFSTATQPSSGVNGAQSGSASGHLVKVFPIFMKSSNTTNRSTQMSRSAVSRRSLLLPPPSSPVQTSLLPLPSLSSGLLVNNLTSFDIPQDFHLPDDQFASLKLNKLRQVAVDAGVEHFTSLSHSTRRSDRRSDPRYVTSDPAVPLLLPLSLTPTITNSPLTTQPEDLQNVSVEYKRTLQSSTEESSDQDIMKTPGEQQTENLHPECPTDTTSTQSVIQDCAAECVDQCKERDIVILNTQDWSTVSVEHPVKPQPHNNFTDGPTGTVNDYIIGCSHELQLKQSSVISSEEQTDCPGAVPPLGDQMSTNQTEVIIKTFDCPLQKTPEEPPTSCSAVQLCNDGDAPGESPVQHLHVKSPAQDSKDSSEPARDRLVENQNHMHHKVHSQLLLSPPLASAPCSFINPHPPPSALLSSPALPSLGLTPHPVHAALPLSPSPSAPALTLPPPHSPSTQALSPPALSPCPSLPPSQPPSSPTAHILAPSELLNTGDQSQREGPPNCPVVPSIQSQGSDHQTETAEEHMMRCSHTLKAPAGGCLVDACCLPGSSGGLCVAAAGKWAVCLWSQTSASDWSLTHTWAFSKPVINMFLVPDAAGLMCVTLGQLEIREVRVLSCSPLSHALLCEGIVQVVVGASKSRVVTSSHSASGSTLQVFTPSDSGSTWSSQPLASPGVSVGALAPVDGLSDALIGSDEGRRLFIWNLKTGQLLRRINLRDGLSHMTCLRGYSYCGVLFVLLQHHLLSSLEVEAKEEEEEKKKAALFSLVAVNPLSGTSVVATRLHPPKAWSGRLCEADVNRSSVVGLSQSGCVCVWELGRWGASRMLWAPESDGWQLARWGEGGTLVTGHHNGDVTLHYDGMSPTSLCH